MKAESTAAAQIVSEQITPVTQCCFYCDTPKTISFFPPSEWAKKPQDRRRCSTCLRRMQMQNNPRTKSPNGDIWRRSMTALFLPRVS